MSALKRAGEPGCPRHFLCLAAHTRLRLLFVFSLSAALVRPWLHAYLPSFRSRKLGESYQVGQSIIYSDGKAKISETRN